MFDQVKEDEMGREFSTYGEEIKAIRILVGNPEGMRPLVRPRRRWEENIKMVLTEISWSGIDCIHLGEVRDPLGSIKCLEILEQLSYWRLINNGSAPCN
jgi:hypothetical protein